MRSVRRKSAPKVRNGKVQKKNRWQRTRNCYNVSQPEPVIDRRRPGKGHRHVVTKRDMQRFIRIIPEWDKLAVGLDVALIDSGGHGCMGWFRKGVVAVCAWERELVWEECCDEFFKEHQRIFDKLGVHYGFNGILHCKLGSWGSQFEGQNYEAWHDSTSRSDWTVEWTENLARAFLLTHVFIHELGHHHDCMTTKSKIGACRGESYAENYAQEREDTIIDRYFNEFGFG